MYILYKIKTHILRNSELIKLVVSTQICDIENYIYITNKYNIV